MLSYVTWQLCAKIILLPARHIALALLGGMLLLQSTAGRQMCQVLSKLQLAAVAASMLMEGLAVLGCISCHSICAWPPHS